MQDLKEIVSSAKESIEPVNSLQDLDAIRVHYLGKKGLLTDIMKQMGSLSPEERPAFGQKVNEAKEAVQSLLNAKQQQLKQEELNKKLSEEALDITLPGRGIEQGSLHPITKSLLRIEEFFSSLGFDVVTGPEIEDEYHNFDALNIPSHHPARASHDTFYLEDGRLLRTHTSPVQIRYMKEHKPPFRMIAPGRVYRFDFDVTHTPMFHQLEGLMIDDHTNFADLKGLLKDFMSAFFEEEVRMRFRPSYFPFTEPSAEVDISCVRCKGNGCRICSNTGWLEVLGCGMVHPVVLQGLGIDTDIYSGFAFGVGIDRLTMLRYEIDDLRSLFENDLRFLEQF